jgi:phosphohistidine phosphatase
MEIYLLRHGAAERKAASGNDADRRLTPEGISTLRGVLKQARSAGLRPSLILSSPYVRAVETARIAARLLHYPAEILQTNRVTPDSSPEDLWTELRSHGDAASILVVTHEPLVSATVCWMLGSHRAMIEFAPAMMVRVDVDPPGAEPRGVLRRIFTADGSGSA